MDNAQKAWENEMEALSEACFSYLVQNPEDLKRFMDEAGYSSDSIGKALGTPALDAGMIEFFVRSEPLLLALCANAGLDPERFVSAWRRINPQD